VKALPELYKRVIDFNIKGGIKDELYDSPEWWKQISLQTKLLVEESSEAQEAAVYGDKSELLDGCIDSLVIAFKLADMLDKAGFDVVGAFEAVCNNNDSKIFNSYYEAVEEKEKLEMRDDVEYTIETSIHNGLPFYSIRNYYGKIAKKVDFVPVDLNKYVPE
jgi:hypothetical protein